MPAYTPDEVAERRRLEDILRGCGQERAWLEYKDAVNRGMVRALLPDAREAGISVREISRLTGLSTQTLHSWMRRQMRPVAVAHYGLGNPAAHTLEEAALRTIAQDPDRDWSPDDVLAAIPTGWPSGSVAEVDAALETLVRGRYIWVAEAGRYRLAPPPDTDTSQ